MGHWSVQTLCFHRAIQQSELFEQHRNSVTQRKAKRATALPSHQTLALLLRRGFRLL